MSALRLIPASAYRRMPWKNGGGETVEIAVDPPDAGLDAFDWRLSMASVAVDGPFSLFPGIDRTLSVLTGAGIALAINGAAPVRLERGSAPLSFPADVPVDAWLTGGPITDLNVMSRRGRVRHRVGRHRVERPVSFHPAGDLVAVLPRGGDLRVTCGGETAAVAGGDTLLVEVAGTDDVACAPAAPATDAPVEVYLVELWRDR